jgi:hypothetical protein
MYWVQPGIIGLQKMEQDCVEKSLAGNMYLRRLRLTGQRRTVGLERVGVDVEMPGIPP